MWQKHLHLFLTRGLLHRHAAILANNHRIDTLRLIAAVMRIRFFSLLIIALWILSFACKGTKNI